MVAVDEFLLRDGEKSAGLDLPCALHSTGGGEGPAGSALSLVLDWGDSTCGSPVDAGWDVEGEVLGHTGGNSGECNVTTDLV